MSVEVEITPEYLEQFEKFFSDRLLQACEHYWRLAVQEAAAEFPLAGLEGGGLAFLGTMAIPGAVWIGSYVALGAGYAQARALARKENSKSGWSQGFVLGLLSFSWDRSKDLFYRKLGNLNPFDEEISVISVKAYNVSLKAGYAAGAALPANGKHVLLARLKRLAGHPSAGQWSDRDKINYVIALAAAGLTNGVFSFDD